MRSPRPWDRQPLSVKHRLKAFIIRWQLRMVLGALVLQVLLMGALAFAVPKISNLTQALLVAAQGTILLVVMLADVLKDDE